jgi:hypothetical protein
LLLSSPQTHPNHENERQRKKTGYCDLGEDLVVSIRIQAANNRIEVTTILIVKKTTLAPNVETLFIDIQELS